MKTIFIKFSNERKPEYQIKTSIMMEQSNQEKCVFKAALNPLGSVHIKRIIHNFDLLVKNNMSKVIKYTPCERISNNEIKIPFVNGNRFNNVVVNLIKKKDFYKLVEVLSAFFDEIKKTCKIIPFYTTEESTNLFGDLSQFEDVDAFAIANLDLILDNVICKNGCYEIIDYEWIFQFPIPLSFISYRILNSIPYFSTIPHEFQQEIYTKFSVDMNDNVFCDMDFHFQNYVSGNEVKLDALYKNMDVGITNFRLLGDEKYQITRKLGVFGGPTYYGVSELKEKVLPDNTFASYKIENSTDVEKFEFHPIDTNCILRMDKIIGFKEDGTHDLIPIKAINTGYMKDNLYYAVSNKLYFEFANHNYQQVDIEYVILGFNNNLIREVSAVLNERDEAMVKYSDLYDDTKFKLLNKDKELLSVGEKLNDTLIYSNKVTEELKQHVEMLVETRADLQKHVEMLVDTRADLQKHVDVVNSLTKELLKKQDDYLEIERKFLTLQTHMDKLMNLNSIKSVRYLSILRKERERGE